ncbi:dihydrofolate reductase [Berryella wangjianweii]|uniref:dihydrofolate reductase n=1 Tax=Berryella wangjianweii TaxID=2734634 RepID=UPI0028F7307F|nr:dihydrofolate reductase [Berryella wangjianweii]
MTQLKAIVAVCDDWGIGLNGDMVVSNRADMRHFVRSTAGHAIVMGRRTLESFPGGRPLPNRRNIVLSRDAALCPEGVEVVGSLPALLQALEGEEVAWVVGGGEVYRLLLPYCDEAVVTKNHVIRPADTSFPNLDESAEWRLEARTEPATIGSGEGDEGVTYSFCTYRRTGAPAS